ncbi:MAG: hypothetical protein IJ357_08965 [Oscillospiraceae bacterium]|nr:hypothetical protein [Oscillospiraceae bacterium]
MCKKNEWIGTLLMAVGAGLLISLLFSSEFIQAIIGILLLIVGLWWARKP